MQYPEIQVTYSIILWLFLAPFSAFSQKEKPKELIGQVHDNHGNVVKNARVYNVSKGEILSTGLNGNFRVKVESGDTITVASNNFKSTQFIVPGLENDILFQNLTITFDAEQAKANYMKQKLLPPDADSKEPSGLHTITWVGRVLSSNGAVLKDANIAVGNSMKGAVTNKNGVYRIQVNPGDSVYFSYMGHSPQAMFVDEEENEIVIKDVTLVPTAIMLQDVEVAADKNILDLDYSKVGMDAAEVSRKEIRSQAIQTDKTYIPMFGLSTAYFGGLSEIFNFGKKKNKVSRKVRQRQVLMRNQILQNEELNDSIQVEEGNL